MPLATMTRLQFAPPESLQLIRTARQRREIAEFLHGQRGGHRAALAHHAHARLPFVVINPKCHRPVQRPKLLGEQGKQPRQRKADATCFSRFSASGNAAVEVAVMTSEKVA
jgi:hypothetical protein